MAELKDFIDNWQVNIRETSATHNSGMKFRYVASAESIDGIAKIEMSETDKWNNFCVNHEIKGKEVFDLRRKLHKEFIQIYQEIINVPNVINFNRPENSR